MLYSTLMLMMSSAFLMLRLAPGSSFPPPLSAAEEQEALEAWMRGDEQARDRLIAHNLRLVAHIIKKYFSWARRSPPTERCRCRTERRRAAGSA